MAEGIIHSPYGGSSAHRWTACPGSVRMNQGRSNETSEYAKEGTLAHAVAEFCLKNGRDASFVVEQGWVFNVGTNDEPDYRSPDEEMARHVQMYLDLCRDKDGERHVEMRVNFDPYVPNSWGFIDHVLIAEDGTVYVDDLKYGQGDRVEAENNTQLLLYSIGVMNKLDMMVDIKRFVLRIIMPRLDHVTEWEVSYDDMLKYAEWFHERYKATLDPEAPLIPGEKQCKWCSIGRAGECSAQNALTVAVVGGELEEVEAIERGQMTIANVESLNLDQVSKVIEYKGLIEKFVKACEARAIDAYMQGDDIPGFKVVSGKSNRVWSNPDKVRELLKGMRIKQESYLNLSLLSPAQIEKNVGSRQLKKLDPYIVKPEGKPTLVPLSDKREPLPRIAHELNDDDDFGL